MLGWKTYAAGAASIAFGIYQIATDEVEAGINRIIEGLAIIGIGHKIDRLAG